MDKFNRIHEYNRFQQKLFTQIFFENFSFENLFPLVHLHTNECDCKDLDFSEKRILIGVSSEDFFRRRTLVFVGLYIPLLPCSSENKFSTGLENEGKTGMERTALDTVVL